MMQRRISAVIVLHGMTSEASQSYQSLLRARAHVPESALDLKIWLEDNTSGTVPPKNLPPFVCYTAHTSNRGLAGAYNKVLTDSLAEGYEWLLTLDQDTELPENTFVLLLQAIEQIENRPDVAAIVPVIRASGRIVSPNIFRWGAWAQWIAPDFCGIPDTPTYAFNSGSMLRLAALRQVRGYSPWFWLDNSDAMIYRRLSQMGKSVYVAGNLVLDHDFSMLNMAERVSSTRYENILLAESAFWDLEMNWLAAQERNLRLLVRLVKHYLRRNGTNLCTLTQQALHRRLFWSRRRRLENWRTYTEQRLGGAMEDWTSPDTSVVSCCLITQTQADQLQRQVDTLVSQLRPCDEIVVLERALQGDDKPILQSMQRVQTADSPHLVSFHSLEHQDLSVYVREVLQAATGNIIVLYGGGADLPIPRVHSSWSALEGHATTHLLLIGSRSGEAQREMDIRILAVDSSTAENRIISAVRKGETVAFRAELLSMIFPLRGRRTSFGSPIR